MLRFKVSAHLLPLLLLSLTACTNSLDSPAPTVDDINSGNSDPNNTTPNNNNPNNTNNGAPNNGDPNNGDPNNGDPNNGDPNNGDPNNTNNGDPNNGGDDDGDDDGLPLGVDCNDDDPSVGLPGTFYPDVDGDGLGDGRAPVVICVAPEGFVTNSDDLEPECATNDTDVCGICGGEGDHIWFADIDGDGLGDDRIQVSACTQPEGFVAQGGDLEPECVSNDTDECGVCAGNNADKDCHGICFGPGLIDDCDICDGPGMTTYYADLDEDALGDPASPQASCTPIEGFVLNNTDLEPACATNDTDDCGLCAGPGPQTYFPDVDGDGLGDSRTPLTSCEHPEGFVDNGDDPEPACATNDTDECRVCAGRNADKDCDDVCFGEAFLDTCDRCVGGETGLVAAVEDRDGDGTPDLCDVECLNQRRFIVQWSQLPTFNTGSGGPYTFQLILFENGDMAFQYEDREPYQASPTVGLQGPGGVGGIEFGFNNAFIMEQPTVTLERDGDARFIADYAQPLYWLDIRSRGTALTLDDDDDETVPLGFDFPFYSDTFASISIASNGFVGFTEPYPPFTNAAIPAQNLGAFIAPFWEDLNPQNGGTIHYLLTEPTCEADCNGIPGGLAISGDCGVCVTNPDDGPAIDCNGICGGTAFIDGCGLCAGGDTDLTPRSLDCNAVCGGTAFIDDCRLCVGGDTGLTPTPPDECPTGVDLIVNQDYLRNTVSLDHINVSPNDCLISERCVQGPGNRKVIRFGTSIANIGTEDLQLGSPNDEDSFWHFDQCHSHYHFEAYAAYQLFDVAQTRLLDIGSKNGFCVLDSGVFDPDLAPNGCAGYNCGNQGISSGCYDTYGPNLQCQWIDVTGVADGIYDIVVTTNPEAEIPEITRDNNSARVRVRLQGEQVTVLPDQP